MELKGDKRITATWLPITHLLLMKRKRNNDGKSDDYAKWLQVLCVVVQQSLFRIIRDQGKVETIDNLQKRIQYNRSEK